jgi:uncharacterized protein
MKKEVKNKMNVFDWIAGVFVVLMGINNGLVGLFHFNIIGVLFGVGTPISMWIYILNGVAALGLVISTAIKIIKKK